MPEAAVPLSVSPLNAALRHRRTVKLACAAAAVLGLPLAGLAYKLAVPAWTAMFKEAPIRPFVEVPPERKPALAPPAALPTSDGQPVDSTKMITHENSAPPAKTAPPPAPPRPMTVAKTQTPPARELPPDPPPWATNTGATPPTMPTRMPWLHLHVKTFHEQEAAQQPTMFLMNLWPQDSHNIWSTASQKPAAQAEPAQDSSAGTKPAVSQPAPAPAPPAPKPAAPRKKSAPIPLHPAPKIPDRYPGQAAITPQTRESGADPIRFQPSVSPAPPFNAATRSEDGSRGVFVGTPDLPPSPNPPTTGVGPATLKPIPLYPPPRTGNRYPGEAPNQPPNQGSVPNAAPAAPAGN